MLMHDLDKPPVDVLIETVADDVTVSVADGESPSEQPG